MTDNAIQQYYDKLKENHGGFAAIVWLVVGAILFYTEPAARLFSWQALVYFVVGMFAASATLGVLSYLTARGITELLTRGKIVTAPTNRAVIGLTAVGYLLFAVQAFLIYVAARWVIRAMF